jgi:hypothetical protein
MASIKIWSWDKQREDTVLTFFIERRTAYSSLAGTVRLEQTNTTFIFLQCIYASNLISGRMWDACGFQELESYFAANLHIPHLCFPLAKFCLWRLPAFVSTSLPTPCEVDIPVKHIEFVGIFGFNSDRESSILISPSHKWYRLSVVQTTYQFSASEKPDEVSTGNFCCYQINTVTDWAVARRRISKHVFQPTRIQHCYVRDR